MKVVLMIIICSLVYFGHYIIGSSTDEVDCKQQKLLSNGEL